MVTNDYKKKIRKFLRVRVDRMSATIMAVALIKDERKAGQK